MKLSLLLAIISSGVLSTTAHANGTFQSETALISDVIKCPAPKITKTEGMPDLWGCILPGAEVVKVFVNADAQGGVENVKVMWNDWTRDVGYGVHTDEKIALAWLAAIATQYAPESVDKVLSAFMGEQDVTLEGPAHTLSYTYWKGPAVDERLFTISTK